MTRAEAPREVGGTLTLGFSVAPAPFDLRLEQSDNRTVAWRTEPFLPRWVGANIRWDVEAREGGTAVSFRHDGFDDDAAVGHAAFISVKIMVQLQRFAETGHPVPVFS